MWRFIQVVLFASLVLGFSSTAVAQGVDLGAQVNAQEEPEWERWDGGTIALQALLAPIGGISGGLVFGAAGVVIGFLISDDPWAPLGYGVIGAGFGGAVGTVSGIQLGGIWGGGDGSAWATTGGMLVGMAAGGVGAVALSGMGADAVALGFAGVTTVAGGIVGYHLSASGEVPSVALSPTDGGGVVWLQGNF